MSEFRMFSPEHGGPCSNLWLYILDSDEDGLYRAISPWFLQSLRIADGSDFLVPYKLTDFQMDVGDEKSCPVIRVRRFPFQVGFPEMTRARALYCVKFLVDFVRYCLEAHEVVPADIHEGNLLWWDRPYFVDYDAIRPLTPDWCAYTFAMIGYLFYRYVLGHKLLRHDRFNFVELGKLDGWMGEQTKRDWKDFTNPEVWTELRDFFTNVEIPPPTVTHWSSEYKAARLVNLSENPKFAALMKIAPSGRTMLDVGCNRGYTGRLLRDRYRYILGFDRDEGCIDGAAVEPDVNFACFTIEHLDQQTPTRPIVSRFRADVVIALAVTHHFETLGLPVDLVARVLSSLTRKYLLIEDIANVGDYNQQFKAHGLVVADHCPSYPSGRSLTLWQRNTV